MTAISAGAGAACAIDGAGQAWCWGDNLFAEQGHSGASGLPTAVSSLNHAVSLSVSLNASHVCAIVTGGDISCWGMNYQDELGHAAGTAGDVLCPVTEQSGVVNFACNPVPSSLAVSGFTAINAPQALSCGIKSGNVYCWGTDGDGVQGNGSASAPVTPTPAQVMGLPTMSALAGGQSAMCGLGSDHSVWCWGDNAYGSLGLGAPALSADAGTSGCGDSPCFAAPNAVVINAIKVSCGWFACLALQPDGALVGWGLNDMGQTGHPANTDGDEVACGPSPEAPCAPTPKAVIGLP